jgi:hypothetical protein
MVTVKVIKETPVGEPAICEYCGKPMAEGSCCLPSVFIGEDGTEVPVYKWGEEPRQPVTEDWLKRTGHTREEAEAILKEVYISSCGDCACGVGQYHHVGCDTERCPICGGQALLRLCGHIRKFENGETTWK